MNKVLSQAIKKAVSDFKPRIEIKDKNKGPDLFSLNDNTELFQNSKGACVFANGSSSMYIMVSCLLLALNERRALRALNIAATRTQVRLSPTSEIRDPTTPEKCPLSSST